MNKNNVFRTVIAVTLVLCMSIGLCACGLGSSHSDRYKVVKTLSKDNCYIGFRNDDRIAYYMMGALSMLIADGTVTTIAQKWLNDDPVSLEGNAEALTKKELKGLEKRNVIIGVDESSYPLAFRQDNNYGGFNVELAQAVCDKLGWTATFLSIEPANTFIELSSGDVDVAWNMPMDKDSEDFAHYGPVMSNSLVIVGLSGASRRINGRSLVTDTSEEVKMALEEAVNVSGSLGQITRITGGTKECFEKLNAGECDYIVCTRYAVDSYNRTGGNPDYSGASGDAQYVAPTPTPAPSVATTATTDQADEYTSEESTDDEESEEE